MRWREARKLRSVPRLPPISTNVCVFNKLMWVCLPKHSYVCVFKRNYMCVGLTWKKTWLVEKGRTCEWTQFWAWFFFAKSALAWLSVIIWTEGGLFQRGAKMPRWFWLENGQSLSSLLDVAAFVFFVKYTVCALQSFSLLRKCNDHYSWLIQNWAPSQCLADLTPIGGLIGPGATFANNDAP